MDLRRFAMIMVQALLMAGVPAAEIRCHPLDERTVYTVRVSRQEPTTCVFPGEIRALIGANISGNVEEQPGILLSHTAGNEYFSLRALKEGATGALNVMHRGKVYALAFITAEEPDRAVVFVEPPVPMKEDDAVAGWRTLMERAKQHTRSAATGRAPSMEWAEPGNTTEYRAFAAKVEFVARFEAEDALVFRIRLQNRTPEEVPYDPSGCAVRLGREIFPAAFAEGSGSVPPKGSSVVWLVVAGAPGGGRANLSVREKFNVIVPQP